MTEETSIALLTQYPRDEYNVLAPETMTQITPWHQITVTKTLLDPDPQSGGDVYPQSGKLALTKIGLLKLADAAGIRFGPTKLKRYLEDGSFEAFVIAEKQDPDGTWRQYPGSYFWDVTERLASIGNPISRSGKNEAKMIRTFAAQRAETGAMNRAIRNIIGVKATYTPGEIRRPFIMARVNFNPFNDPAVRDAYRMALGVRLAENVALMQGDFDLDDPLGLDGPSETTRPSPGQLEAAKETIALLNGRGKDDTPDLSNATAEDLHGPADDPEPEAVEEPEPHEEKPTEGGIDSPRDLLTAVTLLTAGYYNDAFHRLGAIRKSVESDTWPPAGDFDGYAEALVILLDHAEANKAE